MERKKAKMASAAKSNSSNASGGITKSMLNKEQLLSESGQVNAINQSHGMTSNGD